MNFGDKRRIAALAATTAFGYGLPAAAQTNDYVPPKLVKQGTAQSAIAGAGHVKVQVLVKPDGSFVVEKILQSTNPADNKAALEIAQSSKYQAATKAGKAVTSFYTYELSFTGSGMATNNSGNGTSQYLAMIRAGNYAGAKSGLTAFVAAHPDDPTANALLGVADTYAKDYSGAAAAFDKAGTVPAAYKPAAREAYLQTANSAISARDGQAAVAAAQKLIAIQPDAAGYAQLGEGQILTSDFSGAAQSFTKARDLGVSEKLDPKTQAILNSYLALAYFRSGQLDAGTAALAQTLQLDPTNKTALPSAFAAYALAADQQSTGGNTAGAAAMLEKAATTIPSLAGPLYTRAAGVLLSGNKPDNTRASADAQKALAIDANNAEANYYEGVALANTQQYKNALTYMQKAQSLAQAAKNDDLATRAAGAIKQLSATPAPAPQ